ncbi:hypothetical protein B1218_28560, partial [Pseudomonas ogarae]
MFGISFTELLLVGLVALLVLGPERLPGAARTGGRWGWLGRLLSVYSSRPRGPAIVLVAGALYLLSVVFGPV